MLILSVSGGFLLLTACSEDSYTPKPRSYHRIDFPEKTYQKYQDVCPFSFEYPEYSSISKDLKSHSEPCWMNVVFPDYQGVIHISYKTINKQQDLADYIDDSHTMVYKHTVKAESIRETRYDDPGRNVHGILYDIGGNAASSVQFFITDSTMHFLRGSLYIETEPNRDSLAPVINFFKQDIIHLMETLTWY